MSSKNYNIIKEAKESVKNYINFYNNKRLHGSLNYKNTYLDFIENIILIKIISDKKNFYSVVKINFEININE